MNHSHARPQAFCDAPEDGRARIITAQMTRGRSFQAPADPGQGTPYPQIAFTYATTYLAPQRRRSEP
jgi:hypothetical protein